MFTFGDATFHGGTADMRLIRPIIGMATTPDGRGYWPVAADGGVFTFGDATSHGSAAALQPNQPLVGIVATSDGGGYWLVAGGYPSGPSHRGDGGVLSGVGPGQSSR